MNNPHNTPGQSLSLGNTDNNNNNNNNKKKKNAKKKKKKKKKRGKEGTNLFLRPVSHDGYIRAKEEEGGGGEGRG